MILREVAGWPIGQWLGAYRCSSRRTSIRLLNHPTTTQRTGSGRSGTGFGWIGKHAWTANLITYVVNIISPALPCTTLFALKRALYRLSGLSVGPGAKLGSCMSVYSNGEIIIGANVWLGRAANFNVPKGARVVIGDSCEIAPYVKFMCGSHLIGSSSRRAGACTARDISIGKGCWIGASVTVLGGAEVHAWQVRELDV